MLTFLILVSIIIAVIATLMAICGETAKIRARAIFIAVCALNVEIILMAMQFNSQ